MKAFRFGILAETMDSASQWQAMAREVEALSYDTLLIRDHFVPDFEGNTYAPIAALTVSALSTQRLRVGTLVLDNDFRHPIVMAKEIVSLDVLSNGRIELGLGAGWMESEYQQMGIPFDAAGTRVSRLEEAIQVYKKFFLGQAFSYQGKHYQIENFCPFPVAEQRPHPPILIGAGKERMCKIAGREANIIGLMTVDTREGKAFAEPELLLAPAIHEKLAWIKQGAGERFAELEFNIVANVYITEDREKTASELIEKNSWNISPEMVLEMPARLIGTVEEICQQILVQREAFGLNYYIFADKYLKDAAPIVAALAGQ